MPISPICATAHFTGSDWPRRRALCEVQQLEIQFARLLQSPDDARAHFGASANGELADARNVLGRRSSVTWRRQRELNFKPAGDFTQSSRRGRHRSPEMGGGADGLIGMGIRPAAHAALAAIHEVVREAMRQADVTPASGLRVVEERRG